MVMMTLVVIFVLTGFVIIRLAVVNHQRLAELGQRAGIVAERVALSATPTIWSIFDKSLDRHYTEDVASAIIDSELLDPIVSGVVVEGSFGHLFMGKVRTASGDIEFYDRQKHAAHLQTVDVIASHPIRQGILTIGSVNVYATPPPFSQTLQETLLLEFIEIAVTVGVIIFGLLIVINRTLLVPARQMAIARQAFESLNDGLFVTDPEGRLIDANTAYRKKLSSVADDGSDPPIQVLDSEIAGNLLQIWEGNSQHDGWQGETQIEDPSGKIVPVLISTAPVRDEGVRTGYTVTLVKDVTEQKASEEALQELLREASVLNELAQQANAAKSEFLATMSHELRTPLNAIIGFTEMLALPGLKLPPEKIENYHATILHSARHLLSLINDILDLAKVDAGKFEVRTDSVDIGDFTTECIQFFQTTAQEKQITLRAKTTAGTIHTDNRLLKQILLNILSNAVKFSPGGSTVELSISRAVDGGIQIEVADEGPGLTEDEIVRVMEPFVQLENSYTRTNEGTGLGIPLITRFAGLIGGDFRLLSTPGKGTRAIVIVPDRPAQRHAAA